MPEILGNDAHAHKSLDPFTATDEQLAEIFADPEYVAFLDELDADRAEREERIAAQCEAEFADRFGNGDEQEG